MKRLLLNALPVYCTFALSLCAMEGDVNRQFKTDKKFIYDIAYPDTSLADYEKAFNDLINEFDDKKANGILKRLRDRPGNLDFDREYADKKRKLDHPMCVTCKPVWTFREITGKDIKKGDYSYSFMVSSDDYQRAIDKIFWELTFNDNNSSLPDEIGMLTSLEELNLSRLKDDFYGEWEGDDGLVYDHMVHNLNKISYSHITSKENITELKCIPLIPLVTICRGIKKLKSLTSLDLSGNNLKGLPKEIWNLASLTSLKLSYNKLKIIPDEIVCLVSLTSLDLSRNNLEKLPPDMHKLTWLNSLDLEGNNFGKFLRCDRLPTSLTDLDLSKNKLGRFPIGLENLTSLTRLNLDQTNMARIPEKIEKLKLLKYLNAAENNLEEIHDNICSLSELEYLDIYSNNLKKLPDMIGNLKNLESLYISENGINILPNSFGGLTNLKDLTGDDFDCYHLDAKCPPVASHSRCKRLPYTLGNILKKKAFNISIL